MFLSNFIIGQVYFIYTFSKLFYRQLVRIYLLPTPF